MAKRCDISCYVCFFFFEEGDVQYINENNTVARLFRVCVWGGGLNLHCPFSLIRFAYSISDTISTGSDPSVRLLCIRGYS